MPALETFLKRAGWKPRGEAWASRSGRPYRVLEEVAPGAWDRSASAYLAKAILQARSRAGPGVEAIAVLRVKRASPLTDERLASFVDEVAPEQSWILLDADGRIFPHVAAAPELRDAAAKQVVQAKRAPAPVRQQSLFTDLNQWMIKVLLAPYVPEKLLTAPRGRTARNASSLAALAGVSLPAAARFVHALDADGQLDTRFGDLRVARPLDLLRQWRDRTGNPTRREVGAASVRGPFQLDRFLARATSRGEAPELVLGIHAACDALGFGHVSGAVPVVWTRALDAPRLEALGLVAVQADQRTDVVLRVPRFPESLFRGVVAGDRPATDVLQCWLDASHTRVRGQEQADFLWRNFLEKAFRG